jgi:hypothetical protein
MASQLAEKVVRAVGRGFILGISDSISSGLFNPRGMLLGRFSRTPLDSSDTSWHHLRAPILAPFLWRKGGIAGTPENEIDRSVPLRKSPRAFAFCFQPFCHNRGGREGQVEPQAESRAPAAIGFRSEPFRNPKRPFWTVCISGNAPVSTFFSVSCGGKLDPEWTPPPRRL